MRPRPIALVTLLFLFIALPLNTLKATAQQTYPLYLTQFPSVDKVLNAMKTSDPRETAIRQIGAFYQLVVYQNLSGSREFRGFTPDANYQKYGDRVDQLPVDAHMLIALIAPRPVLLQTGDTDLWSDPKGEFLAAVAAAPVYRLLDREGMDIKQMPAAGQPIMHTLGYYMHAGGHGTIPADWAQFLKFMQLHLRPGT